MATEESNNSDCTLLSLMPEHVHLLVTPASDLTIERAIQFIKGGYLALLRHLNSEVERFGKEDSTDHRIRDAEDFALHRDYIHQNPVKRRLVEAAVEYRYCSAYPGFKLDERTSAAEARIVQRPFSTTESCPSQVLSGTS